MERAIAVGMFDGVHLGHQSLVRQLRESAQKRGLRPCAITFSEHPLAYICPERAPKLLTACSQKIEYLRKAGADEVIVLDFNEKMRRLTAREFMRDLSEKLGVKLWMMGFNHRFGSDCKKDFNDYVSIGEDLGVEVELAGCEILDNMDEPLSSSLIRRNLEMGEIEHSNMMLGRPYSIIGRVEEGKQIGRTIGFPTANIKPMLAYQALPKRGAYACQAIIGHSSQWAAMTNIGCRPTIGEGLASTIETHLIGFEGDLYGKEVEVRFLSRLRGEMKFSGLDALKSQLAADLLTARSIAQSHQDST